MRDTPSPKFHAFTGGAGVSLGEGAAARLDLGRWYSRRDLAAAAAFGPAALLLALVYPAQVARLYGLRKGYMPIPLAASVFHVLGRFPEAVGQIRSERDLRFGHSRTIIEYK